MERHARELTAADIRKLVGKDDPFIVEVGCNDGTDTVEFLRHMPGARIVCFEPDPRPLARFKLKNHPQVTLHACGAAHRAGELPFWPSTGKVPNSQSPCKDDWDYSGGFSWPAGHLQKHPAIGFKPPVRLPVFPLDAFLESFPPVIDFIWADTQGSEAKLILGGQKTLQRTRYFYTEFYDNPMYERQPNLYGLECFLLDFAAVAIYCDNVLFKHIELSDE